MKLCILVEAAFSVLNNIATTSQSPTVVEDLCPNHAGELQASRQENCHSITVPSI